MTLGTGRQSTMSARRRGRTSTGSPLPQLHAPSGIPLKLLLPALVGVVVIVFFALWGGNPQPGQEVAFMLGIAVLALGVLGLAAVGWHLLLRPLPAGHLTTLNSAIQVKHRRLISLLIALSTINLMVGGIWDEVWHRAFGVPLGEDFFWMPHILIYTTLLFNVMVAFGGLFYLMRFGKGTLQQRFRADFVVGLMILLNAYMLFIVPADPIWHSIYGVDISGLSIPHIILGFGFIATFLMGPAMMLTTLPPRKWAGLRALTGHDVAPLVAFVSMVNVLLPLLTIDWYVRPAEGQPVFALARPDWLLVAMLIFGGAGLATLVNHSLRRYGTATIVALGALVVRAVLLIVFELDVPTNLSSWLLLLFPMVAVDLLYAASVIRRGRAPHWREAAIAAMFGMMLGLPLINNVFVTLQVGAHNLLGMVVAIVIVGLAAAWFGTELGNYLATQNKRLEAVPETAAKPQRSLSRMLAPLVVTGLLVFLFILVQVTPPPV